MHIALMCHLELYTDGGGNNYFTPGEFLSFLAYKKCLYFYASFILMERVTECQPKIQNPPTHYIKVRN